MLGLVYNGRCAHRALGQGSGSLVEQLRGRMEIRNTHPGKERQIQDWPCAVISTKQNPSHCPEQEICE